MHVHVCVRMYVCVYRHVLYVCTDQSSQNTEELDDIGVGDRVETAEQRVRNGNDGRHDHRNTVVNLNDHRQCRACKQDIIAYMPTLCDAQQKSVRPANNPMIIKPLPKHTPVFRMNKRFADPWLRKLFIYE